MERLDEQKKAAIYVRVSTDKQEADNQLYDLRGYCKQKKYYVFSEYVDIISGNKNSRPKFNQLFNDAHKGLFDIVIFWDLSRFSRSGTLYTLQKLKELENINIDWDSYQEKYFKSVGQFKDVVLSIIATVAKIEREKISERTKSGLRNAQLNGKKLGRPRINKKKVEEIKNIYKNTGNIYRAAKISKVSYSKCWNIIKRGCI